MLARVFAPAIAVVIFISCLLGGSLARHFKVTYSEMGAVFPRLTYYVVCRPQVWITAVLVLWGVTLYFIWGKGRVAAWMAGTGLLLLAAILPITIAAMFSPLFW